MEIRFEELEKAELIVDCVYKGGTAGNMSDEGFLIFFLNAVMPRDLEKFLEQITVIRWHM